MVAFVMLGFSLHFPPSKKVLWQQERPLGIQYLCIHVFIYWLIKTASSVLRFYFLEEIYKNTCGIRGFVLGLMQSVHAYVLLSAPSAETYLFVYSRFILHVYLLIKCNI